MNSTSNRIEKILIYYLFAHIVSWVLICIGDLELGTFGGVLRLIGIVLQFPSNILDLIVCDTIFEIGILGISVIFTFRKIFDYSGYVH